MGMLNPAARIASPTEDVRPLSSPAPRVAGSLTSMAHAAATIVDRYADGDCGDLMLRVFDRVPARHGVVAAEHDTVLIRSGEVAVYDEESINREGLIDGAVYAIAYQRARGHLPQHMWAESPSFRMQSRRQIVIVRRHSKLADRWMVHPVREHQRGYFVVTDGPYELVDLADKLVGRVVGIFNPSALTQAVQ